MNKLKLIFPFLFILLAFSSCEDVIDLELDEGRSQLVIDAFVNSDSTLQTIRLTKSAAYFLNGPTPPALGATVQIIGPNNQVYPFIADNQGNYQYDPATNGKLDSIGFRYQLRVDYEGKSFSAYSRLNPVPPIDSITYEFEEAEPGSEAGYYAQFYARDFAGSNDFYWAKAFKNGKPINPKEPADFILSQNAAFSGDGADGFIFILPIRFAINNEEEPYEIGDSCSVILHSINEDVFNYLIQVATQASNDGLFATPTANVKTNITDIAGNIQEDALGVFSMSSLSRNGKKIK